MAAAPATSRRGLGVPRGGDSHPWGLALRWPRYLCELRAGTEVRGSSALGTCGWLQPPSRRELSALVVQDGRNLEKGQGERGARAGRAGLSHCCHPCTARTASFGPADQKLCPVAKAGGHSLGLRIRCHISALAYSQDNFLEANGSLRDHKNCKASSDRVV